MEKVQALLKKLADLNGQDKKTIIDIDLMLDHTRKLYEELLQVRTASTSISVSEEAVPHTPTVYTAPTIELNEPKAERSDYAIETAPEPHVYNNTPTSELEVPPAESPYSDAETPTETPVDDPSPTTELEVPVAELFESITETATGTPVDDTYTAPTAELEVPEEDVPDPNMETPTEIPAHNTAPTIELEVPQAELPDHDMETTTEIPVHNTAPTTELEVAITELPEQLKETHTLQEIPPSEEGPAIAETQPSAQPAFFNGVKLPGKDIRKVIGINDKYQIMSELFSNNKEAYEMALNELNTFPNYSEAHTWLRAHLAHSPGWDEENYSVQLLYGLMQRFFAENRSA